MYIRVLGSGSNGNATIFHTDKHSECILFDCGVPYIKKKIGDDIVIGCFITHTHSDHCSKLKYIHDIPIYCGEEELIDKVEFDTCMFNLLEPNKIVYIGPYAVMPLVAEHDTSNPLHFFITDGEESFFYGCDCSYIPMEYDCLINSCQKVMLECDYDETAIETDRIDEHTVDYCYPSDLKERVLKTHCGAAYIVSRVTKDRLICSHLSNNYNSIKTMEKRGVEFVDRTQCPKIICG